MRVGESVVRTPETFADYDFKTRKSISRPLRGKVVYIHPKGRFHVVEFACLGGAIREAFLRDEA